VIAKKMVILVVSDNPELTKFFQEEGELQNSSEFAVFEYAYSEANKNPDLMENLGAKAVDVKDPQFCIRAKDEYNLIISIHCKQIFPINLVCSVTCVNFHPGLNPYNRGWFPQVFSIINKMPAGVTLHVMDAEVDHGVIIDQREVFAEITDTSLDLYNRVIEAEKSLIKSNLLKLINQDYSVRDTECEGNYNSISDFKELCRLDLSTKGTLGSHIDLLRSLSHGEFKNAYFTDEAGKKIYVRIALEREK